MVIVLIVIVFIIGGVVGAFVGKGLVKSTVVIPGFSEKPQDTGFSFDAGAVVSISDDAWLKLKGDPNAVRRYIDERASKSEELVALRKGVVAARRSGLEYYAGGYQLLGDDKMRDSVELARKSDALEKSLAG